MKRFVMVCVLALPLAAVPQQKAAAWCQFNFGGSFNLNFACGGHCFQFGCSGEPYPGCWPGCYGGGYGYDAGYPVAGYGYDAGYPAAGYGWGGYYTGTPVPSTATPSAPSAPAAPDKTSYAPFNSSAWGYQPVGYYQAPSYWYQP